MNSPHAVTLRPARLQDAQTMASMSRELIESGLEWRYTPPRIGQMIRDRETMALVACDGAVVQGYAVMQFGDTDAHLALLCVRRPQQRRGIGRRLTEWLVASARVAGIVSVRLELRADNHAALAFYRRLGFNETHQLVRYYDGQFTARCMALPLRG